MGLFKKKEKKVPFTYHYFRIVFNKHALEEGIFDNYQKEIEEVKGKRVVNQIIYSDEDVKNIEKVLKLPIVDMTKPGQVEEFKFDNLFSFGEVSEVVS